MVPFYGWGSTASRIQWHYKETVYYLPQVPRNSWYSQYQGYLDSTALPLSCFRKCSQYQRMKYFEYIVDKIGKTCSPDGNHHIFSADLTRLTKMFFLSCIYLYILNMYAETASYRPLSLYFFFHNLLWVNIILLANNAG